MTAFSRRPILNVVKLRPERFAVAAGQMSSQGL
jgi:hypothetical protein